MPVAKAAQGQRQPPDGHYEIRNHLVKGVAAIYWVDAASGSRGSLVTALAEDRLPLLAAAIRTRLTAPPEEGDVA